MPLYDQTSFSEVGSNTFGKSFDTPLGSVDIEVGDIKQPDFLPRMKLQRWDNEANLSLGIVDTDPESPPYVSNEGDSVVWEKGNVKAHFRPLEFHIDSDGGMAFDVVLAEPPMTNVLEFTIRTKGLSFAYQQPRTLEEMQENPGCRDDRVDGSYAVYSIDKQGDFSQVGGQNYGCGKLFHIYRPLISDSRGHKVWGAIYIGVEAEMLSVTIPQDFLDSAEYPVTIDPDIGYTGTGGTIQQLANTFAIGQWITGVENGSATSASWYIAGVKSTTLPHHHALYSYDANEQRLAYTGSGNTTTNTPAWFRYAFPTPYTMSATSYWLANINNFGGGSTKPYYDDMEFESTSASYISKLWWLNNTYSYGNPTVLSGYTANTTSARYRYSAYLTYTAGGGGASYPIKMSEDYNFRRRSA